MKISKVIRILEQFAPISLQENYDNSGLLVGDNSHEIKSILITLDITEEVIEEAIAKNCNLIIAHHPIIFSGLKSVTGKNYVERCVIKAIKNDIAIYSMHTNLDNTIHGVNKKFAEKIGLTKLNILAPKSNTLKKLTTYVPLVNTDDILEALTNAGAGNIGEYESCSFQQTGIGTFKPTKNATPYIGVPGKLESVQENRIEVIVPEYAVNNVLKALNETHPYEEIAYYLTQLENKNQDVGSGMIGELKQEYTPENFLQLLKKNMNLDFIKYTPYSKNIKKVAICGGSGHFLIQHAKKSGADAFITSDIKYHDFFNAENQIMICDIGHYESEVNTKEIFYEVLSEKITNIALVFSETNTNPIRYYK